MIISVNKVVKKGAKRVKGYLQLRGVLQLKHVRSAGLLPYFLDGDFPGGFLGLPGFLCSLMIVLNLPKIITSL